MAHYINPLSLDGKSDQPKAFCAEQTRERAEQFFQLSKKIWNLIFLSLPLDALIVAHASGAPWSCHQSSLSFLWLALLATTILFLPRDFWFKALYKVKDLRKSPDFQRRSKWLAVSLLTFIFLLEGIRSVAHSRYIHGVVTVVAYATGLWALFFKERGTNPAPHSEIPKSSGEEDVFLLTLAPIVLSRAVSLAGAWHAVLCGTGWLGFLPGLCGAMVLLSFFLPSRDNFISPCKGCAGLSSRSRQTLGFCSDCAERLKLAFETRLCGRDLLRK